MLISGGQQGLDIEDMRAHVQYAGGYHEDHPIIQEFWRALADFTPEEQGDFLRFCTSCPRPPLLGFKYLEPPLAIQVHAAQNALPGGRCRRQRQGGAALRAGWLPLAPSCCSCCCMHWCSEQNDGGGGLDTQWRRSRIPPHAVLLRADGGVGAGPTLPGALAHRSNLHEPAQAAAVPQRRDDEEQAAVCAAQRDWVRLIWSPRSRVAAPGGALARLPPTPCQWQRECVERRRWESPALPTRAPGSRAS